MKPAPKNCGFFYSPANCPYSVTNFPTIYPYSVTPYRVYIHPSRRHPYRSGIKYIFK